MFPMYLPGKRVWYAYIDESEHSNKEISTSVKSTYDDAQMLAG